MCGWNYDKELVLPVNCISGLGQSKSQNETSAWVGFSYKFKGKLSAKAVLHNALFNTMSDDCSSYFG